MEKETPEENLNQACVRVLKEMTKETPTEEWEEADLFVDIAPEASHKIVNYPGRLNARLMLKGKDVGGLKELLTSHDAELARKIGGMLPVAGVRNGAWLIEEDAVLALLTKK